MKLSIQALFTAGCFFRARDTALTTMSLKLTLTPSWELMALRASTAAPMSTESLR